MADSATIISLAPSFILSYCAEKLLIKFLNFISLDMS